MRLRRLYRPAGGLGACRCAVVVVRPNAVSHRFQCRDVDEPQVITRRLDQAATLQIDEDRRQIVEGELQEIGDDAALPGSP